MNIYILMKLSNLQWFIIKQAICMLNKYTQKLKDVWLIWTIWLDKMNVSKTKHFLAVYKDEYLLN